MYSTHYMDLLMQNSPWNLILFMAIPVILAETIAITELFLLKSPNAHPTLSKVNRTAGILAGGRILWNHNLFHSERHYTARIGRRIQNMD